MAKETKEHLFHLRLIPSIIIKPSISLDLNPPPQGWVFHFLKVLTLMGTLFIRTVVRRQVHLDTCQTKLGD